MRKVAAILDGKRVAAELALTEEQQLRGLCGRTQLLPWQAMWFPFETPRKVSFTMKDVSFPIDILFTRNGNLIKVARNMQPGSKHVVSCEGVTDVFEIAHRAEQHVVSPPTYIAEMVDKIKSTGGLNWQKHPLLEGTWYAYLTLDDLNWRIFGPDTQNEIDLSTLADGLILLGVADQAEVKGGKLMLWKAQD